jgi:hypothetical protein
MRSPHFFINIIYVIFMYCIYKSLLLISVIWDSSEGIATMYGLDGPGIESRWEAIFSAPVQTGPGAHTVSNTMGNGCFPAVKRPGRGVDHPPHIAVRLRKE